MVNLLHDATKTKWISCSTHGGGKAGGGTKKKKSRKRLGSSRGGWCNKGKVPNEERPWRGECGINARATRERIGDKSGGQKEERSQWTKKKILRATTKKKNENKT